MQQFEIKRLIPMELFGYDVSFTNASLFMVLALAVIPLFYLVAMNRRALVPGRLQSIAELSYEFIANMVRDIVGEKGMKYFPWVFTIFMFILVLNLLGLVPYGSTATGNLAVTAGLALTTFALVNFAGIKEQGLIGYFAHIVPKGVPLWLYPLLFPIELIGMLTKSFALCVRLFANMIAGHIVILSFIGLIFMFGAVSPFLGLGVAAPAAVLLILFVLLLELFVAFLQAYIFTFLTAIFTGASMHPH